MPAGATDDTVSLWFADQPKCVEEYLPARGTPTPRAIGSQMVRSRIKSRSPSLHHGTTSSPHTRWGCSAIVVEWSGLSQNAPQTRGMFRLLKAWPSSKSDSPPRERRGFATSLQQRTGRGGARRTADEYTKIAKRAAFPYRGMSARSGPKCISPEH
jgi:hypothetical protein